MFRCRALLTPWVWTSPGLTFRACQTQMTSTQCLAALSPTREVFETFNPLPFLCRFNLLKRGCDTKSQNIRGAGAPRAGWLRTEENTRSSSSPPSLKEHRVPEDVWCVREERLFFLFYIVVAYSCKQFGSYSQGMMFSTFSN